MIHTFRNDMKKWRNILWVVLASLVVSYFSSLFYSKQPTTKSTKIGSVSPGGNIYVYEFLYQLRLVHAQRRFYEQFTKNNNFFSGLPIFSQDPADTALQSVHENKLIDHIADNLGIVFDKNLFYTSLAKELPESMFDPQGRLKEREYAMIIAQNYGIGVDDFEQLKMYEQKRTVIQEAIEQSAYVTKNDIRQAYVQEHGAKSFAIATLAQEPFTDRVRAQGFEHEQIRNFYSNHAEAYRQPQQREFEYWTIAADSFKKDISVSDDRIQRYYNKNEVDLFRIPPEVKVRHIRVATKQEAIDIRKTALEDLSSFASLAKKHSTAEATAKKGGLVDFFKSGTLDRALEVASFALTKENPLSEVIKTADGYEIVLLVDRKNASSKPLSMVKDEIIETIKHREAVEKLSGVVKRLSQELRDDERAIDDFVAEYNLAVKNTGWVDEVSGESLAVKGLIAKKAFAYNIRYGVTPQHDRHIIFREIKREASKIPPFSEIEKKVEADYINDRAQTAMKNAYKEAKKAIISGEKTLEEVAAEHQATVITTGLLRKSDGLKNISSGQQLLDRAFFLSSKNGQIATKRFDGGYHLAVLRDEGAIQADELAAAASSIAQKEKERLKRHYYPAFVASLQRHATLKTNNTFHEILNSIKHTDER